MRATFYAVFLIGPRTRVIEIPTFNFVTMHSDTKSVLRRPLEITTLLTYRRAKNTITATRPGEEAESVASFGSENQFIRTTVAVTVQNDEA